MPIRNNNFFSDAKTDSTISVDFYVFIYFGKLNKLETPLRTNLKSLVDKWFSYSTYMCCR